MDEKVQQLQFKIKRHLESVILDEKERLICVDKIESYVSFLCKWLAVHNVVSRKNADSDIWENVYDSIVICEDVESEITKIFLQNNDFVDAGAGGGFPGVLLAIIFPKKNVLLVDSNRKKCSFLRAVKAQLHLDNVEVLQTRIEDIEPVKFMVTKAAFSPAHVGALCDVIQPKGGLLIWANNNTRPAFEEKLAIGGMHLRAIYSYDLPDHKDRCLLLFEKH